jgi:molybdopterin-guanine dinucleotide biosynthesis protein A
LAGGKARRLGGAKAGTKLRGRYLVSYPVSALCDAGLTVAVVAKPETRLPELSVPVWLEPDEAGEPVFHPLSGVVSALKRAGGPIVAFGCDMPFVTAAFAGHLASLSAPLALPSIGGKLEPLAARYEPSLLPALEAALAERAPLREALARLDPLTVGEAELARFGEPDRLLSNVNTPAELASAETLLARESA